jgi:hypothetical protein
MSSSRRCFTLGFPLAVLAALSFPADGAPAKSASAAPRPKAAPRAAVPAKIGMSLPNDPNVVPFLKFFAPGPRELRISPAIQGWNGKRVKIVGFMADLENPSPGSFYLASRPVKTDEEGDSTGDLPPTSVRIFVRSAHDKKIGFIPGPLSATGILKIGPMADAEGRITTLNLILDRPEDLKGDASPPVAKKAPVAPIAAKKPAKR